MIHPKIALSLVSILPGFVLRAQQLPANSSPAVPVAASKSPVVDADLLLASWLTAESNGEVVLAKIAVRRTQTPEVEQFAKHMIDEHAKLADELRPFTGAAEPEDTADVRARDAKVLAKAGRKATEASGSDKKEAEAPFDHVALMRDLSQRCTAEQAKLLEAKASAEFDRSFMQAQVGAHTRAVIMVDVFHSRASSELRPALEKIGKMLRSHLEQATTLCKKCESAADNAQSQDKQK